MSQFSLVEAENEFMKNRISLARPRPGLYPSEASVTYLDNNIKIVKGECLRSAWFRIMGYQKDRPDSPGLNMKAKIGKACERITVDMHKDMGLHIDNNIKFFIRPLIVSGELDWVFRNPETNQLCGAEQKTYHGMKAEKTILGYTGTKGSKNVAPKPPIPGRPKTNQFLQAITYQYEYQDILPEYRMYYMDRGNGTRVEFEIGTEEREGKHICWYQQIKGPYWKYFSPDKFYYPFSIEDIHLRFKELSGYAINKILPSKDYDYYYKDNEIPIFYADGEISKTDYEKWEKNPQKYPISRWECSYCSYNKTCEKEG